MALNLRTRLILLILIIAANLLPLVISARHLKPSFAPRDSHFKEGDVIPLFANILHSPVNECLDVPYFDLPFCPPGDPIPKRKKSLEEILAGDCFTRTQYELKFKMGTVGKILCEKNLTKDEVGKFRNAIINKFEYDMSYNNIFFGEMLGGSFNSSPIRYYLVRHIEFYPYFYQNQVKDIKVKSHLDSAVDITEDSEIRLHFTYSVFWKEFTDFRNETAMMKDGGISKILSLTYWVSLWLGLLGLAIVPYLRHYFTRYSLRRVKGWVHGHACSGPPYSSLLGAFLSNGFQHLIMICFLSALVHCGVVSACSVNTLIENFYLMFCLTFTVSAFMATSFHSRYTARGMKECIFQTGFLSFVPVSITLLVAFGFADLPQLGIIVKDLFLWGPLTAVFLHLGGSIGGLFQYESHFEPCMARKSKMVTPWQSWLMDTPAQMFLGGLLPFMAILKGMDEIYASLSLWKVCGAFSAVLLNFILVITMTILVGVAFTIYQLSREDFNWWWRSVLRGGSTAIFMFAYGIYFHSRVSQLTFADLIIITSYTACFCYALFLVLGTISFCASSCVVYFMNPGMHHQHKDTNHGSVFLFDPLRLNLQNYHLLTFE